MIHKEDITNELISNIDGYGTLYVDVSDDGDGVIELTPLGEQIVEWVILLLKDNK